MGRALISFIVRASREVGWEQRGGVGAGGRGGTKERWCFFGFFFNSFIYLFLAALSLRFCERTFSSCGKWGPLFIAVRGPLAIAASLVAEHRLQTRRLSNCGSRA